MKMTVSLSDFRDAFKTRPDNFTYEGLEILFDFFENIDEDMELNVIAICCEFYEDCFSDIVEQYDIYVEGLDDDDLVDAVREYLVNNTTLVGETDTTFIYAIF